MPVPPGPRATLSHLREPVRSVPMPTRLLSALCISLLHWKYCNQRDGYHVSKSLERGQDSFCRHMHIISLHAAKLLHYSAGNKFHSA
jgi:hypothetical protein